MAQDTCHGGFVSAGIISALDHDCSEQEGQGKVGSGTKSDFGTNEEEWNGVLQRCTTFNGFANRSPPKGDAGGETVVKVN